MAISINLLKKPTGLTQSQYEMEQKLFRSSLVVFLAVIVLSVGMFVWQLFVTTALNNTEKKIRTTETQLAGLSEASIKQLYLKSRLQAIGEFLESRINSREALRQIFSIRIPGVYISSASFENDRLIALSVSASNVITLDEVYDYFEDEDLFFPQVLNSGVSRNNEGEHTMNIQLTVPN